MVSHIPAATGANAHSRSLSGGGRDTSGAGRSDGGPFGHARGGGADLRPCFNAPVPQNGYRWWYIDGLSDDGRHGLTIIGFVGSVFSPYYFKARKVGAGDPENFCSINVALYGATRRWAMTERTRAAVLREALQFRVGPSQMKWEDNTLVITIDERCTPWPHAIRGEVRLTCDAFYDDPLCLSEFGQHHWRAVAPRAQIKAAFEAPSLTWSGHGYHDMNWGDAPLEDAFASWTWQRSHHEDSATVFYDAILRDGSRQQFGRSYVGESVAHLAMPKQHTFQRGLWRMTRDVRSESSPVIAMSLEDAPFYTRDHLRIMLGGKPADTIHESLSLTRFAHPLVQRMLPYRMLRVG